MRIVVCSSAGDMLFSGESQLSEVGPLAEELETQERTSTPPESGVFGLPTAMRDDDNEDSACMTRPSGIFSKSIHVDDVGDDGLVFAEIDLAWMRLSA
jgi:hypothetical protein